jgi:hypothetical protein
VSACQETEEAGQESSPTETATASPAATLPVPTPTLPPIPADWPTHIDPGGLFAIRYPLGWFEIDGDVYSSDPRASNGYSLPPEIIKIEVTFNQAAGSDTCGGTISVDPNSGESLGPLPGATPANLGGVPAWQMVRLAGSGIEEGLTRTQGISVIYGDYCVMLWGYFTQQQPEVTAFLQVASTFEFKF